MVSLEVKMKTAWAFVIGLAAGTALGVMFAPRSGEETQDLIGRKARAGLSQAAAAGRKAGDQVKHLADKGKEQVAEAFEAGKKAYQEAAVGVSAAIG
jgi:gas vesicle protein